MSRDDEPRKREERSERERKERQKFKKRVVGEYKMIFFFLQSSYNELVLIQAHCSLVLNILGFRMFDGSVFLSFEVLKNSI